ncbi:MAG TPA: GTPase [Micromonosporaceae bacterium]|nr:GTPase [Micromonosporaceae bacterium]
MTGLVNKLRGALTVDRDVDGARLVGRVAALGFFLNAVEGHLPDDVLVPAHTVVEHAGQRLALSREHTVVALAGSTGSGKSSIFNAMARRQLSPVGVRRPTTGVTHACIWGPASTAAELLDWLGVLPRHRYTRESVLDGEDEAALRGLVLLDLPDFDSVEAGHRLEVDRLLALVDMIVWVVDPQKYADQVVHDTYLRQFHRHREVTVVALNHADRLSPADVQRCLVDLRGLLDSDGLAGVPALASSAVAAPGHGELSGIIEQAVLGRRAALRRLSGDMDRVVTELSTMVGPEPVKDAVDTGTERALSEALAQAAGVPAVVDAAERAYRHRAAAQLGWPLLRWLRRLRPDPVKRLHLAEPTRSTMDSPVGATSLPEPTPAVRAAVGLAVRTVADRAAGVLPGPWPAAVGTASRARLADLPDALDRAVAATDLGLSRTPWWWRLMGGLQWLAAGAAVVGLGWLLVGYLLRLLGLPTMDHPRIGAVPVPTALLLGGLLAGALIAGLGRVLVAVFARRTAARTEARLRAAVAQIADEYVIAPVRTVLRAYGEARVALAAAAGDW